MASSMWTARVEVVVMGKSFGGRLRPMAGGTQTRAAGDRCTTSYRAAAKEKELFFYGRRETGAVLLSSALFSVCSLASPTRAEAKIRITRRPPASTYEERKRRMEEARRIKEAKEDAEEEETENIVTLPSGVQYRELVPSDRPGAAAAANSVCDVTYVVYRLAPGAYFKYSSGGTPIYLFSRGYGNEGMDDLGSTFTFTLGDAAAVPLAVQAAVVGMRPGMVRRVLIPPYLGWDAGREVELQPDTFGGRRRLENHRQEPLLMDVELVKVRTPLDASRRQVDEKEAGDTLNGPQRAPYRLPTPPRPK